MTLHIGFEEGAKHLDWLELTDALAEGHRLPQAQISDSFLYRGADTLLQRQAWIDGLGIAVKSATIFPGNTTGNAPVVNGAVTLFDDQTGELEALVDFHLVTKMKTAADSLLAARRLARPDSNSILIVGAGAVARSLREAYGAAFPTAEFKIWNRTARKAEELAAEFPNTSAANDLEMAVRSADIVTSATLSTAPVIRGEWLQPGQHIDLIGAYRPDMREVDDEAMRRATVFVDSCDTTVEHIGELIAPLESGALSRDDIAADYYHLDRFKRASLDEITLFKNGGGAHLDLMTSRYILDRWKVAN
ncbi:MAG: ornithine cyclodeaminase [Pseudomonadota bacterium]|nr:ornithine cyclodeaminase [Pseudomonadota bacterium]